MTDLEKFWTALNTLKSGVQCTVYGDILSESDYNNNIHWNTGVDENGLAITTTTNPHSEITWTKLKTEMDKL
jgi:hypothetical protein|tara:strand:- start:19 stop:234 length:216 start_codon:yes stop_codon:yes gene_type:complete